jgi:hypothetical protein
MKLRNPNRQSEHRNGSFWYTKFSRRIIYIPIIYYNENSTEFLNAIGGYFDAMRNFSEFQLLCSGTVEREPDLDS